MDRNEDYSSGEYAMEEKPSNAFHGVVEPTIRNQTRPAGGFLNLNTDVLAEMSQLASRSGKRSAETTKWHGPLGELNGFAPLEGWDG